MPWKGAERWYSCSGDMDNNDGDVMIIAKCFAKAVKDVCEKSGESGEYVQMLVSRYVNEDPDRIVRSETKRIFASFVESEATKPTDNEFVAIFSKIQIRFCNSLYSRVIREYKHELDYFFERVSIYLNLRVRDHIYQ